MRRPIVSILLALTAALAINAADAVSAAPHPYSIDDYLALEATGKGAGRMTRIVWEQAPPYDEIGYYGHNHIGAWAGSGFSLRTIDLAARKPVAAPLFEPEPGVSYWFDSFSPDGRYLAFYGAKEGVFFMGAYDTVKKRVRIIPQSPLVHWSMGRESLWVSPDEFIFSAYEGDAQPLAASRPYTGRRLAREHENAWRGAVSVSTDTTGSEKDDAPQWKRGRLLKANARTGAVTLLAEGTFESLTVSADGRFLAALRQADLPPPDPAKPNIDWVRSRSELALFDLQGGREPQAVEPDKRVFIETLAWAPDRNRLAFFAWNENESVQAGVYHALDAETGAVTPYPHKGLDLASERERGFAQKPERVMWVDGRLAVLARAHEGEEHLLTYRDIARPGVSGPGKADWFLLAPDGRSENLTAPFETVAAVPLFADANTIAILADGDVWRVGPGRAPKNLTAAIETKLTLPSSIEKSTPHRPFRGEAILLSNEAGRPGFALIDFASDEARFVSSPSPGAEALGGAVSAGAVLFRQDHDDGADLILAYADGRSITLDRLNEHMAGVARTKWTTIIYRARTKSGERELESCVLLPPGYEAGKRYPVIVEIYPGRGADCLRPSSQKYDAIGRRPGPYSEHLLAARGYVVIRPNMSAGLTQTEEGPLAAMASMTEQAVEALVDQGVGDPARVGLLGFSQGGFSSLWLATQSSLFKATVSLNGWSDMYAHYFDTTYLQAFYAGEFGFTGEAARYEATAGTDFPIGGKPYDAPLAYVRESPLFNAPGVSAPVLLIHSDMDIFALQQYERMFVALHLQGKKAKLLRYWGEGHAPSSPGNSRHMWREILAWFDCYVKDAEAVCAAPSSSPRPKE